MKKILFTMMACAVFFISCDGNEDKDNCVAFKNEPVDSVVAREDRGIEGQYLFDVNFHCTNGCGNFDSFEETVSGNTRTIKVLAKYEGCICTQDIPARNAIYEFMPPAAGTYTLKFVSINGDLINETVVAN